MTKASELFTERTSIEQVEEGHELAPKFDEAGLIACVTTDASSGEVLMLGYMTAEALQITIEIGEAVYFSRSRQTLWHKGATSGLIQKVREIRIDDDQDAIWLSVDLQPGRAAEPASCHVGYRSCFYRRIELKTGKVSFTESEKKFDPEVVYPGAPNPTIL